MRIQKIVVFESTTIHQRLCTRTCVTFDNGDYSLSRSSVTREAVRSTSWKFSTLWKFSQHIVYIFRTTRSFVSKFETLIIKLSNISIISAYVQIAFTCRYVHLGPNTYWSRNFLSFYKWLKALNYFHRKAPS